MLDPRPIKAVTAEQRVDAMRQSRKEARAAGARIEQTDAVVLAEVAVNEHAGPMNPAREQQLIAALAAGCYLNSSRNVAIVFSVSTRMVRFITMINGTIEVEEWSRDRFVREFHLALPGYPLRRAARIFNNSFITRTDDAQRVLRGLMVS